MPHHHHSVLVALSEAVDADSDALPIIRSAARLNTAVMLCGSSASPATASTFFKAQPARTSARNDALKQQHQLSQLPFF